MSHIKLIINPLHSNEFTLHLKMYIDARKGIRNRSQLCG